MESDVLDRSAADLILDQWAIGKNHSRRFLEQFTFFQSLTDESCRMLPRFKHILVPVDMAAKNRAALDITFELAVENKAKVSLLHVTERIERSGELPDEDVQAFYHKLKSRFMTDLEAMSQRFADAGVDVESKVLIGDPLQDTISFCQSHHIDLIVMSSHPIDPNDSVRSWGTLSYKVSVVCTCPILLVKSGFGFHSTSTASLIIIRFPNELAF